MKKTLKNAKGITLVALVITIIILLILATISIQSLTNTGLFQKANEAKEKTQNAAENQAKVLEKYEVTLNQYDKDTLVYKVNNDEIKIGQYVDYIPDTANSENIIKEFIEYSGSDLNLNTTLKQETNLKWRVLDVQDGKVRLISAMPTSEWVTLKGYNGYNNGVKLLDDACSELYNNSKFANNVQNLKIEDITKHMTKKPIESTEVCNPKNIKYPKILEQEKNQTVVNSILQKLEISNQNEWVIGTDISNESSLRNTFWYQYMDEESLDAGYYELFVRNGKNDLEYWMSSRCVIANSDSAEFLLRIMYQRGMRGNYLYYSNGNENSPKCPLRPIVTLNSNVKVTSGDGSLSSPFSIQ